MIKYKFIYEINKRTSTKTYWISQRKDCEAHVQTDRNNNFLESTGEHNHLLEPEVLQVNMFREIFNQRVIDETIPVGKIYDEEISRANFTTGTLASVPFIHEIRKNHVVRILEHLNIFF